MATTDRREGARRSRALLAAGGAALALAAAGCDRGGPAAPARGRDADATSGRYGGGSGSSGGAGGYGYRRPREAAVPLVEGHPMWSDNRQHSAEENAQYHFQHDGQDFGASSVDAYVKMAHDFVDHPPADAQTLKRANGDTLIYDAAANTFAVKRKDGAPRTMFKPHAGAAYWQEQKEKIASGDDGYARHRTYHAPTGSELGGGAGSGGDAPG